jgi:hypothetical protein
MAKNDIKGMKELEKTIKQLGKLPQKCVTPAAKKGANIPLKDARANSPYLTGDLENGIVLKGEKATIPGKKVYQITMDSAKNDIFIKMSKGGNRAYYPASQEYGFFTKNGRYIPGIHFLKNSITKNSNLIEKTIVDVLSKQIDKLK